MGLSWSRSRLVETSSIGEGAYTTATYFSDSSIVALANPTPGTLGAERVSVYDASAGTPSWVNATTPVMPAEASGALKRVLRTDSDGKAVMISGIDSDGAFLHTSTMTQTDIMQDPSAWSWSTTQASFGGADTPSPYMFSFDVLSTGGGVLFDPATGNLFVSTDNTVWGLVVVDWEGGTTPTFGYFGHDSMRILYDDSILILGGESAVSYGWHITPDGDGTWTATKVFSDLSQYFGYATTISPLRSGEVRITSFSNDNSTNTFSHYSYGATYSSRTGIGTEPSYDDGSVGVVWNYDLSHLTVPRGTDVDGEYTMHVFAFVEYEDAGTHVALYHSQADVTVDPPPSSYSDPYVVPMRAPTQTMKLPDVVGAFRMVEVDGLVVNASTKRMNHVQAYGPIHGRRLIQEMLRTGGTVSALPDLYFFDKFCFTRRDGEVMCTIDCDTLHTTKSTDEIIVTSGSWKGSSVGQLTEGVSGKTWPCIVVCHVTTGLRMRFVGFPTAPHIRNMVEVLSAPSRAIGLLLDGKTAMSRRNPFGQIKAIEWAGPIPRRGISTTGHGTDLYQKVGDKKGCDAVTWK